MLRRFLLPLALPLLASATVPSAGDPDFSAQRFRAHVAFLADDRLEGRDTGSRGYDQAAAYVADQFAALGLQPAGDKGSWYQKVTLRSARLVREPTVTLIGPDGTSRSWQSGTDVIAGPGLSAREQDFTAQVVFAGFGIDAPGEGIRDYAGLDVRGKLVAVFAGTPPGLDSETAAFLLDQKAAVAAQRGALGLISLPTDESERTTPWAQRLKQRSDTHMTWMEGAQPHDAGGGRRGAIALNRPVAEQLFAGARHSYAQVRAEAGRRNVRRRGFLLPTRMRLQRSSSWSDVSSPNVVALLPGSDPALRGEYVVLMGHLDHIGVNAEGPGDRINNGALDNAAGIATMLEAARAFAKSGVRPRRSILFVANTAEEKGLLGADYFVHHPPVPLDRIVAAVALDMPLLLYDFTDVIAFGAEHSSLAASVKRAAARMNVALSPDPMPEEHIFIRSDHYRFVQKGIPAILLMTGFANGGEAQWKHFLAEVYHGVSDDMKQPIHWQAGARYARLNYLIASELANADTRPLWYRGDLFGDTFAPGKPRGPRPR
jgi:hypothetical protein